MKANNSMNYRALTVTGILAAFVWCMACSFFIAAIGLCSSVSVRWETGGVSPSALVRQQKICKAGWPCKAAGGHAVAGIFRTGDHGCRYGEYDCGCGCCFWSL